MIHCTACGAAFAYGELKCPYCGNVHTYGAEKDYMEKLQEMRDDLRTIAEEEASPEADASLEKEILEDHAANMGVFDREYKDARGAVGKKLKKHGKAAWQWVLIAALVFVLSAMVYVHLNAFVIFNTNAMAREASRNHDRYVPVLDGLLEEGDFLAFTSYFDHYNLFGILDDYKEYRSLIVAGRGYADVVQNIASDQITRRKEIRRVPGEPMAGALLRFYEGKPAADDPRARYFDDMENNLKIFFSYYYDIEPDEFETFRGMTATALAAHFAQKEGGE